MTNAKFKEIKTGITSMEKLYLGLTDKFIGVVINGVKYNRAKQNGKLTIKQLDFFKYLPNYKGDALNL